MTLIVSIGVGVVRKQSIDFGDRHGRVLGCAIAIGGSNRIVVGSIDRHHDVLTNSPTIVVIDEDLRGDREAFANAEEVEVLVDNVVVPVDFAGVGIAGLGADRDACFQYRDLG